MSRRSRSSSISGISGGQGGNSENITSPHLQHCKRSMSPPYNPFHRMVVDEKEGGVWKKYLGVAQDLAFLTAVGC